MEDWLLRKWSGGAHRQSISSTNARSSAPARFHNLPSRRAAKAFLARLKVRDAHRDAAVTPKVFLRQLKAITAWGTQPPQDLGVIRQPVLIANGDHDIMVPSENSRDLARRIPGAELVFYPDAGHGGIFQYHELFADRAIAFLDA